MGLFLKPKNFKLYRYHTYVTLTKKLSFYNIVKYIATDFYLNSD